MKATTEQKKLSRLEGYYLTTNIKGVLILFLAMYHFISGTVNSSLNTIEDTLGTAGLLMCTPLVVFFLCATPIFVFITGYGSKDTEACRNTAFTLYFIPYLVLTLVMVLEIALINGLPIKLFPFEPLIQLWFLLSMFIWMLMLKDAARIRFILPISAVIMLVIGMMSNNGVFAFSSGLGTFFGLSRALYYFPFLLLGFFMSAKALERIRNAKAVTVIIGFLLIAALGVGTVAMCCVNPNFSIRSLLLFKGDGTYLNYLLTDANAGFFSAHWKVNVAGAVITLVFCVLTLLLLFLMLRLMPKKKVPVLTRIGNASYTVFCLHVFIVMPLSVLINMLDFKLALLVSAVGAFAICMLLSVNKVNKTFMSLIFKTGEALTRKKTKDVK